MKALSGENTKKIKVLILRFSSIGDIVLTTPVIRCLKQQQPNIEVHYCTKKSFVGLLDKNPFIDKIWSLDNNLSILLAQFKQEQYDYIIDLHHNIRTWWIKLQLWNVPSFSFPKLNIQKWLYVRFKWNLLPDKHIVSRYLETVVPLGVQDDKKGLDFFIDPLQEVDMKQHFPDLNSPFICFVVGAKFKTKQLPIENMAAWCNQINRPIVLLGGKEDIAKSEELSKMLHNKHLFNATGKFNLQQSASILKQSAAVFTHDTGMMHIASAFNKKIISFWGNTTPQLGMYPYRVDQSIIIENKEIKCRPCSKIGFNQCPQGHFNCMKSLMPDKFKNVL